MESETERLATTASVEKLINDIIILINYKYKTTKENKVWD